MKKLILLGSRVRWVDDGSNGLLIGYKSKNSDTLYFVHFDDDYLNFSTGADVDTWFEGYGYKKGIRQGLLMSRNNLTILKDK